MTQSPSTLPIHIISGFLGAGKTTLINRMLKVKADEHIVLLENEFGEAGIDHQLIQSPQSGIFQINSGCICCHNSNALLDTLQQILSRQVVPDRLIIECTGIALPENIIALFYSDPYLQNHYHIANVVTVIDAAQFEDQIRMYPEPAHQLAYADIVLINKVDLVRKYYIQELRELIRTIQTDAAIIETDWEIVSLDPIFSHADDQIPVSTPVESDIDKKRINTAISHLKYKSHSFQFDRPFDIMALRHLLSVWLLIQKMRFIRIKGIIHIHDEPHMLLIQTAGNQSTFKTIQIPDVEEAPQSTIVVIGLDLDRDLIEKQLNQCLHKSDIISATETQ